MSKESTSTTILAHINMERARQDAQWGGLEHDREHASADWLRYIEQQVEGARGFPVDSAEYQTRMVKIAALAVASLEAAQ